MEGVRCYLLFIYFFVCLLQLAVSPLQITPVNMPTALWYLFLMKVSFS